MAQQIHRCFGGGAPGQFGDGIDYSGVGLSTQNRGGGYQSASGFSQVLESSSNQLTDGAREGEAPIVASFCDASAGGGDIPDSSGISG